MKRLVPVLGVVIALCAAAQAQEVPQTYEFRNAFWFDGEGFVKRTLFSERGLFRDQVSADRVDAIIDLKGGYVLPPLCEAHNHNLGGDYQTAMVINRYLEAGIFYVNILSNLPRETGLERHLFNRPGSVDVSFANGGITGPNGHPIKLRERLLGYGAYEGFTRETLVDHAYFVMANTDDITTKWPLVMQYRPDMIKLFLLYSSEYARRHNDAEFFGHTGLDPKLMPALVGLSHQHDLQVTVHVETGHDFEVAVTAGADVIAHLPGESKGQQISDEAARMAAEKGTVVITTASLAMRSRDEPERFKAIQSGQIDNLKRLKQAGVTLAIGSDDYDTDSRTEVDYLRNLKLFSDRELLTMWTRDCVRAMFPERRIGKLSQRHEASFIVLAENPLEDWSALDSIQYRFKDGSPLQLPFRP